MKYTFAIIVVVFLALSACKSKSETQTAPDQSDNTTSKWGGTHQNQPSGSWSKAYREKMLSGLEKYARKEGIEGAQVNALTNCVLAALEAKFPNEDVDEESAEAQAILHKCMNSLSSNSNGNDEFKGSAGWSKSYREKMADRLPEYADGKKVPEYRIKDVVDCMLGELENKFPKEDVDVHSAEVERILQNCLNSTSSK
ncbi:MAG: hypothetical protein ABIX01_09710 [Chitinophagaceae bacterium]